MKLLRNKLINGSRYFLVHGMPWIRDFILVTEYPRSGGTWLGQLVSGYLGIPFPRNAMPRFGKSLVHGHYLPSKSSERIKQIVWLCRDGRDVMVSLYYHFLFPNDENIKNPKNMSYYRKRLGFSDYDNIKENLPVFIEFMFNHTPKVTTRFAHEGNWRDFNLKWKFYSEKNTDDGNIIKTTYEDLLDHTEKELGIIIQRIIGEPPDKALIRDVVSRFDFSRQTKRDPGKEDIHSFRRKGVSGDWRNHFSGEAAGVFDRYAGDLLIDMGYENDHNWVKRTE